MTLFDARTVYLIVGMLYLFMALMVWIALAGKRSQAVALWVSSCAAGGVATWFFGFRGIAPDWVSMTLAGCLLMTGILMAIQALRVELRAPLRWRLLLGAVVLFGLIFEGIRLGLNNPILRVQFALAVQLGLMLYLASLAYRLGRAEDLRSAHWIAGVYLLLASTFTIRLVAIVGGWGSGNLVGGPGGLTLDAALIPLVGVFTAVISQVAYVGLALERSTRQQMQAAAQQARLEENRRMGDRLAHLDRQRSLSAMTDSLGQQLRLPLVSVKTEAQVALHEIHTLGRPDEASREAIEKIILSVQRASEVIDRIRSFIRPVKFLPVPVDLDRVARELLDLVGAEAARHHVEIKFPSRQGPMWVCGDATQLSQALLNVYRNAIEAMQHSVRREFLVHILRYDDRVLLSVCDSGVGLAPHSVARIGTPFYSTKPGGLGLGLSIARSIIVQHEGTLSISAALGGGLCVDFELPALVDARVTS